MHLNPRSLEASSWILMGTLETTLTTGEVISVIHQQHGEVQGSEGAAAAAVGAYMHPLRRVSLAKMFGDRHEHPP